MKTYLIISSRKPTCIVEHVMVMLFHDIAAIFLTFTILNWIFDFIWYRILGSRWICRWSRRLRRRPVSKLGIVCARIGLVSLRILEGLIYVLAKAQDVLRVLAFYIARGNLIVVDFCLAFDCVDIEDEGAEDVKKIKKKEVKKEASHSSAVVEAAVKTAVESSPKSALKPAIETRSRIARLRVGTSLEDNPNRNWSNEHGNLSPGSSPAARSTSSTHTVRPARITDFTRPLRCERPNFSRMNDIAGPGPSGLSSSSSSSAVCKSEGSGTTLSEPKFDRTAYEEYLTRRVTFFRRAVRGPYSSDATSVSTPGERIVRTPSTSSSSIGNIDTPIASSSSSESVHTPSPIRSSDSGDSSGRGVMTPTSTSPPELEVMIIDTPPSTSSINSGDSSRPSTPDSASSSDSDETVIRTPSPLFTFSMGSNTVFGAWFLASGKILLTG
jgi:hypothetical protein